MRFLYAASSGRQAKAGFTENRLQCIDRDLDEFIATLQQYADVCNATKQDDASNIVNVHTMKVYRASEPG